MWQRTIQSSDFFQYPSVLIPKWNRLLELVCPVARRVILHQPPSSLWYKAHQIPTLEIFSYCLAAVLAESLEAICQVENGDVVGAAPTGDAPTTSEWSTIWLPTKVRLILEVLRYTSVHDGAVAVDDFGCHAPMTLIPSSGTKSSY